MWNIQGSWFQTLNFLCGVIQFCGVSRGEALFSLEFSQRNLKKVGPHPPPPSHPVCFFSGIIHCDTGSLGWSTPAWEVKPLFSHILNIFTANILSKTRKILSLLAFYKLFLSEIKIKILINSCHFLMIFVDVTSAVFE